MSTDQNWIKTEANFWPDQDWIGLQFFFIGGTGLDRTEKICCFDVIIPTTSKMLLVM